jgi:hypothetical protein
MDENRVQMAEDLVKKLRELNEIDSLEQLLKDNSNEFVYQDKHYRVRKPVPPEKEEANKERMKKYIEMLRSPDYIFRKELVALYKTKGINLDAMDQEIKDLALKERQYYIRLNDNQDPKDIEFLEKEIVTGQQRQQEIFLEKEELLKYCIEKQLDDFLKFYLVYLVLEIKDGDKWKKVYSSFKEYMESPEELLQARATQVFRLIISDENI